MAGIFLSYDRDDTDRARPFATALENAGHSVWWDLHVRGGAEFSKVIEEALKAADVVVVLWSANSVESAWVRDEAVAGRDSGRLVPVTIDGTEAPLGFRQFQTIDLSRWKGRGRPPQLEMFLADVATLAESGKQSPGTTRPKSGPPRLTTLDWRIAAVGVALLVGFAAVFEWIPRAQPSPTPTVLVTAGRNDAASQTLARDFAVQLGSASLVQSGSIRLVTSSQPTSDKPSLVLELASLPQGQTTGASLLLKSTTDNALIWSHDFAQGQRSFTDLNLQMASTAARVLGCEADALAENGSRLPSRTRTLYLTSCANTAEGLVDPQAVAVGMSKVVAEAPRFVPAWRKLLLAEAASANDPDAPPNIAAQETLRKHIAIARRLEPNMPEATVAEISLVPMTDVATKMRLIDRAYRDQPGNPVVLLIRSNLLEAVGRTQEATGMAEQAVNIDPSPEALDAYISALAYSGLVDVAEQQLRRAQRLWPGTSALDELEWHFYFRFGDPKLGLQMASNRNLTPTMLMFIQARANPASENIDRLLSFYRVSLKRHNYPSLSYMAQAFVQFHREQELYEMALHWPAQGDFALGTDIWFRPAFHAFRQDPRFMQLAARTPLLHYWRASGKWPDFCSEPGLPYDCRKEAEKLSGRAI